LPCDGCGFSTLAAGLAMLAEAQRTATNPAIEVTTRLVVLSVVVTEKTGRPVTNFSKDDFTVLENNQPQTIDTFEIYRRSAAEI
jgi:hypothetical protein